MSANLFSSYDMVGALRELGILRHIDVTFAAFIQRQDTSINSKVISILAGLVSFTTTRLNNVCLDLTDPLGIFDITSGQSLSDEDSNRFLEICSDISSVILDGDLEEVFLSSNVVCVEPTNPRVPYPMVYSSGKLYLQRYWEAECVISSALIQRISSSGSIDPSVNFSYGLESVYSRFSDSIKTFGQQLGVFTAMRSSLSVITGGPGTGKTTVVSVILALYLKDNPDARIALVAPTGKAQARLKEAVFDELEFLTIPSEVHTRLQQIEFKTIHRLLGLARDHANTPKVLRYDLIVVDEASMVSVLLFQKFFSAVSLSTKIVLLGDRDQLAAVEGGAVLSDICSSAGELGAFSPDFIESFKNNMPEKLGLPKLATSTNVMQDFVVPLEHTFRFSSTSGIGRMKDILSSEADVELSKFIGASHKEYADSFGLHRFHSLIPTNMQRELLNFIDSWTYSDSEGIEKKFVSYLEADTVNEAFKLFSEFQIITALNKGAIGVDSINQLLAMSLGLNLEGARGLPVMIAKNDYQTGLFNGDIGMYWEDKSGKLKVWFPDSTATTDSEVPLFKSFLPSQIPEHSLSFAMTIHKSQGSGFGAVLLLLPTVSSEILTKELLYTGITRAKNRIDIFGSVESIINTAKRKVCRFSGLVEKLR